MKFCAFLRGVNVKGTSMKMAEVCKVFVNAGMSDVSSVLATGNIIFTSEESKNHLKVKLEKAMSEFFDYDAFIFLKDHSEIAEMLANNPFEKDENFHIYVFVTSEGAEQLLLEEFKKGKSSEGEKAAIVKETFYWQIAKGNTLDSDFGKILGKKALKHKITSRNLNTFEKILKKI